MLKSGLLGGCGFNFMCQPSFESSSTTLLSNGSRCGFALSCWMNIGRLFTSGHLSRIAGIIILLISSFMIDSVHFVSTLRLIFNVSFGGFFENKLQYFELNVHDLLLPQRGRATAAINITLVIKSL